MEKVRIDAVQSWLGPADVKRPLTDALGAPQEGGDLDMRRECPDCGGRTPNDIERTEDGVGLVTRCEDCGAETGQFD